MSVGVSLNGKFNLILHDLNSFMRQRRQQFLIKKVEKVI